jgi:hypothetical protein
MQIMIPVGWWILPLAVTIAAFVWWNWLHKDDRRSGGYGDIGQGLAQLASLGAALIVSLIAWLIWALAT